MAKLSFVGAAIAAALTGNAQASQPELVGSDLMGTRDPFAANAVYFVVTDRFVDGDPANNFEQDSGWQLPVSLEGNSANVGYMGGDFKGILNNADYIREMGFSAIWMTPIVENPAEAFTGGDEIKPHGFAMDRGKAAYHGYWGTNFYKLDKHLPSAGLDFVQLNKQLADKGLSTVLDVVINHGSPAYTMTDEQYRTSLFGKLYNEQGELVADHGNLAPELLDTDKPLQAFFNTKRDLAQLADMNTGKPEVMDYFVNAYLKWLGQGAGAMRIDTVKHVPAEHWGEFSRRIRAQYPGMFMFGEVYSFDPKEIGQYTFPDKGGMSVLDFPMKAAMDSVFAKGADYSELQKALFLQPKNNPYANPYDLLTFYDNHDMPRMNASDEGFIDAHNWLFTARGIPVIYYGSEKGFERGKGEHMGNRNYFGQDNVDKAVSHPIRQALLPIANLRAQLPSLQRGLQWDLGYDKDTAAFYRVVQNAEGYELALVLLNKGDKSASVELSAPLLAGEWQEPMGDNNLTVGKEAELQVPAHGVRVLVRRGDKLPEQVSDKLAELSFY
ncbi:cyclomaltodextrin glucanotransferase [Shewanella submarina]|uniref:Alpha-amylase family glycosyl hydrolase n=1 Tax=Shewanella submarina TaxID=2016376 RepID=A0ABV7GLQ1_9GAMM|nr:alpha-amylase family glycosyl hydrolase [Shewanella submarina]MCL1035680.1 cyclomaltodextrin glucanotransferase [Shewanella submarina]